MDKRPIGVFDSGVGGLTVVKKLSEALPHEDIVYLGDTARVPYGSKSKETVTRFAIECSRFLKKFNIKLLVVACNTASSWSLKSLKRIFSIPVIGVIKPAVNEACQKTKNSKIGIIGTKATVQSGSYVTEIKKFNKSIKIYQKETNSILFFFTASENRGSLNTNNSFSQLECQGYFVRISSVR